MHIVRKEKQEACSSSANCAKSLLSTIHRPLQFVKLFFLLGLTKGKKINGVGVITKLYFAIFAAFKKLRTSRTKEKKQPTNKHA